MIINHNLSAIDANRVLKFNNLATDKDMEKLSSGLRINKAADDASGLAVSEKMRAQVRGLLRAEKNSEDAISFIQTAEGYLTETTDIVQRIRELAIQAANGIYTAEDRTYIQVEVSQLVAEIDRVASHAQFNGLSMLTGRFSAEDGGATASMWIHIGANIDQRTRIFIGTMTAAGLGIKTPNSSDFISLSTAEGANGAIATLDSALQKLNKQRADLGAFQNRFEAANKGLLIGAENLQAAESIIRDSNMASEMVNFTKDSILVQSGTAMLAQANAKNQSVLRLLG